MTYYCDRCDRDEPITAHLEMGFIIVLSGSNQLNVTIKTEAFSEF
jgi:hypothetical protein